MIRIIDNVAYESKWASEYRVCAVTCGQHIEVSSSRRVQWVELDWGPLAIQHYLEAVEKHREETIEERALTVAKIAANRAKKNVRQLCKAQGLDTLLTLTYKANQLDLDVTKRHLKEFVRRIKRVLPGFTAIGAFERQKRGAWHVHLACHRIPKIIMGKTGLSLNVKSYDVIRAVWRSVVGDLGGNIDVSRAKALSSRSQAQIAAYISKYITKAFQEGEKWSNRWTKFGDFEKPVRHDLGYVSCLAEALPLCYDLLGDSYSIANARLSQWQDWFFVFGEPIDEKKPRSRG
jgi:hypothetical protein